MIQSERQLAASHRCDRHGLELRKPDATDGPGVWQLVSECPPLDRNSMYCNLLQCTDFADTCIVAESPDRIVGWISGYRPPDDRATLFIWQVAVYRQARGMGLAKTMLSELLEREDCGDVDYLKTTITPDNEASRALFRAFADRIGAPFRETSGFDQALHFDGRHDSERLITIGPFPQNAAAGANSCTAA